MWPSWVFGSFQFQIGRDPRKSMERRLSVLDVSAGPWPGYGTTHSGYGTTPVWWGGGNRYVEGEPRTFGYLMLYDTFPLLTIGYLMFYETFPLLTIG